MEDSVTGIIILLVSLFIYFIPTIVAKERKKKNVGMVVVINLFLGWTLIGWVIALMMAYGETENHHAKN